MKKIYNRLAIFVFYDKDGIVDKYVEYLLMNLIKQVQRIIVVVNGEIDDLSKKKLEIYTPEIYIRENKGYDAGAYKDILTKYLSLNEIKQFDEIVLLNDTFYGPVLPLEDMWNYADKLEADFWGISRHPEGMFYGKWIPSHVQSYFLVVRKNLINSEYFIKFWEELDYPLTLECTIENFEIGFNVFFEKNGFRGKSLMEIKGLNATQNPYFSEILDLIKYHHNPFIKKKCFMMGGSWYPKAIDTIEYVNNNLDYDTDYIWKNLKRLSRKRGIYTVNLEALEKFVETHNRIYIYGYGIYGKNMKKYFDFKGWKSEGFIVSEENQNYENCFWFSELNFTNKDGIILALNKKNMEEVIQNVRCILNDSQIFMLNYNVD